MPALVYEDLTAGHFAEWGADFAPEHFVGYAERRDGRLTAIGAICFRDDGEAWAIFDARPPISRSVHARTLELFAAAQRGGCQVIYATVDPSKHNAEKWMKRIGFSPTRIMLFGQPVWAWRAFPVRCPAQG